MKTLTAFAILVCASLSLAQPAPDYQAAMDALNKKAAAEKAERSAHATTQPAAPEKCYSCHGLGTVPCTHCMNGYLTCPKCDADGTIPCPRCHGNWILQSCDDCNGTGTVTRTGWQNLGHSRIPMAVNVACSTCKGRGYLMACGYCANSVKRGREKCPDCHGSKKGEPCPVCHGTHKMPCPICQKVVQALPQPTTMPASAPAMASPTTRPAMSHG